MRRRDAVVLREAGWVVLEYSPIVRLADALGTLQSRRAARGRSFAALPGLPGPPGLQTRPAFPEDPLSDGMRAAA